MLRLLVIGAVGTLTSDFPLIKSIPIGCANCIIFNKLGPLYLHPDGNGPAKAEEPCPGANGTEAEGPV